MSEAFEMQKIHLGIDATNIRQGGGLTHLTQMLSAANLEGLNISHVTVWCSKATANRYPKRPWLGLICPQWAEAKLPVRFLGQQFRIAAEIEEKGCDLLFSPGGNLPARINRPAVSMSQNMLPFEPDEAALFGRFSAMRLKMWALRQSQGRSFKRAEGLLFLTKYARATIEKSLGGISAPTAIVPHGIEGRFLQAPRRPRALHECSEANPFRVLYVSILMPYKHQVEVARAAHQLRLAGMPIEVIFIGAPWGAYTTEFQRVVAELDPDGAFLKWAGAEPFDVLHRSYQRADAFVFASSCENLPNILIEAMAAGLPIASSDRGPMPEVLGEAGVYFSPYSPASIANAIARLANDEQLRARLSALAWREAHKYSWERCATETLTFIAQIAKERGI